MPESDQSESQVSCNDVARIPATLAGSQSRTTDRLLFAILGCLGGLAFEALVLTMLLAAGIHGCSSFVTAVTSPFRGEQPASETTLPVVVPTPTAPPPDKDGIPATTSSSRSFEIVSLETRKVASNEFFTTLAWKVTLRSRRAEDQVLQAKVLFLDRDDFLLAEDYAFGWRLGAWSEETYSGSSLLSQDAFSRLAQTKVEVSKGF